ncbi:MAG TPA: exosortase/archaeosortase family protein [Bryobacteraceae bacterium]|nr:exosortase/archaeosortase family protein [Bryobacteraceae bacterium]
MSSVANPVVSSAPEPSPQTRSFEVPWVSLAWFFGLLILCYGPVLARLVDQWNTDEDMGHGFFVPAIAAYIAWQKKDELLSRTLKPNPLGIVIVLFAALQLYIGTLGAELFLARTAFVEGVIGVVLCLGGTYALRVMAFPLVVLCFMVPIPAVIYNQITFPLQLFASNVAATVLEFIGIPVLRDGNVLELPSQKLNVVEACSGIRSLLSLTFLSLVYGYFFDKKGWMRAALFAATVPIAILANAARVTLTGVMSEYNPEWAHGTAHTAQGWVIFMIALFMMVVTHTVINRIYRMFHRSAPATSKDAHA